MTDKTKNEQSSQPSDNKLRRSFIRKVKVLDGILRHHAAEMQLSENDLLFIHIEKVEGSPISWLQSKFIMSSDDVAAQIRQAEQRGREQAQAEAVIKAIQEKKMIAPGFLVEIVKMAEQKGYDAAKPARSEEFLKFLDGEINLYADIAGKMKGMDMENLATDHLKKAELLKQAYLATHSQPSAQAKPASVFSEEDVEKVAKELHYFQYNEGESKEQTAKSFDDIAPETKKGWMKAARSLLSSLGCKSEESVREELLSEGWQVHNRDCMINNCTTCKWIEEQLEIAKLRGGRKV